MTDLERRVREYVSSNIFMAYNRMEVESVELDHVVFRLEIQPKSGCNGMPYGGTAYLAEMAAGVAAYTDGRNYAPQNGSLHFVAAQMEGIIRTDARVRHRECGVAVVSVDILGEEQKLLATGEFAFSCTDEKI